MKIVYYGPAASGKTTNFAVLHRRADPKRRGELVSVNSTQERTILLDLLPVKPPGFRGYEPKFQLIGVPGQRMYAASRRLLLQDADTIVFIANAAADRWEETLESLREMNQNLLSHGLDPSEIPIIYQYNKRDLPETTPLDAMDRTLNARHSDSFPAAAVREEGVLETFRAVLFRTMEDLTKRYQIGENLRGGRSVEDWADESMKVIFGWSLSSAQESETETKAAEPSPTAVRVPVASNPASNPTSAATPSTAPEATEALVESYAEAATRLTAALEELREERDKILQRLEDLAAPIDAAQDLLTGKNMRQVLHSAVERLGKALGAGKGSLSLNRPDGEPETEILWNLESDPLSGCKDDANRPLARFLMKLGKPLISVSGEAGPLEKALEGAGDDCSGVVIIPMKTSVRVLGLVCFYLPQESPAPPEEALPHLSRLGQSLALALEAGSGTADSDRLEHLEKTAIVGPIAENALMEIGVSLDRLFLALGRLLRRQGSPAWLKTELLGLGTDLSQAKELRDGTLSFLAGRPLDQKRAVMDEILAQLRIESTEALKRAGIQLELESKSEAMTVRADSFLLRCALGALIEHSRNQLAGKVGALIRVTAEAVKGEVRLVVSDNSLKDGIGREPAPEDPTSPQNGEATQWHLALAQTVIEHFKGRWKTSVRPGQGSETVIHLPPA